MHRCAFQFSKRVCGDPTRSSRILLANALGAKTGQLVQAQVSLSDVAQSPVYGFSYEIPVVARFAFNQGKKMLESRVFCFLVFIAQVCGQSECSALLEFGTTSAPLADFVPGGLRFLILLMLRGSRANINGTIVLTGARESAVIAVPG